MKAFFTWLKSNPYFAAASSALMTFAAKAAYNWVQNGTPALTLAEVKSTGLAALGVVIVALYHLYTDTPSVAAVKVGAMMRMGSCLLIFVLIATSIPVVTVTGCSGSSVLAEINIVLNEADNVIAAADPSAPWLQQLKNAVVALEGAETNWQNGGTVALVDDALNTIVVITGAIPLTAVYSPLIDVLVAGIEAVLAALPANVTLHVRVVMAQNPHLGR